MITFATLLIILLTIGIVYQNRMRNKQREESLQNRPSLTLNVPKVRWSLPFVGNLLQLGTRPHEKLFKLWDEYGPIYQIKLGSQTVVVLNGTNTIREALIDHGTEFAGRPELYMIHATLKGKGLISSPYNYDYFEHKRFLLNSFNRFGKRRSSLEFSCLQTIRETLDEYREKTDQNSEFNSMKLRNSLSQIASQNILTMTFGTRMHNKKEFSTLMDLVAENFKNSAVTGAFNFLPVARVFKRYILKNVFKCSEFLNNLISEKMREFNENTDFEDDQVQVNEKQRRNEKS